LSIIKRKNIKVDVVKKGDKISLDKTCYLDILHPDVELLRDNHGGLNVNSITTKLCYITNEKIYKVLFTADIEEDAEKVLVNKYVNGELEADILKVGHHGSKTSTTEEFLEKINPKIALIGVGEKNTFRSSKFRCS